MKTPDGLVSMMKIREARLEVAVSISALVFVSAHLIASFFPTGRTWGFHHLMFFSMPLRLVFFLCFLIFLPGIHRWVVRYLKLALSSASLKRVKIDGFKIGVALGLVFFPLFWFLRAKTHFLGDGYLRMRSVEAGRQFVCAEPLDSHIRFLLHRMFHGAFGWTGETSYAVVSCFIGAVFIFSLVLLSDSMGKDLLRKIIVFVAVLCTGTIQLFFGYAESYILLTFGLLIYIIVSISYLRGKCSIFFPSVVLSVMFCTHISALALLPSLLFLFAVKELKSHSLGKTSLSLLKMAIGITIPILLLMILIDRSEFGFDIFKRELTKGDHILPLTVTGNTPGSFRYSLFSLTHFIDIFNEIILIAPIGLMLCIPGLLFHEKKKKSRDQTGAFLGILSLLCFLYVFLVKPNLGASRDWDLFAVCGVPWTVYWMYLLINYSIGRERLLRIGLILSVAAFFHTCPWILVNADTERSLERFEVLAGKDATWSNVALGSAYDELASYYNSREEQNKHLEYRKKAAEAISNCRYISNLGAAYIEAAMYEEAISVLNRIKDTSSCAADAHYHTGLALYKLNKTAEALSEFQKSLSAGQDNANVYYNMGRAYFDLNREEEAIPALEKALQIDPALDKAHKYLGASYLRLDKVKEAIPELRKSLEIEPEDAEAHSIMGVAYSKLDKTEEAIAEFQKALLMNPGYAEAYYNMAITYFKSGELDKAASSCNEALSINPEHEGAKKILDRIAKENQGN